MLEWACYPNRYRTALFLGLRRALATRNPASSLAGASACIVSAALVGHDNDRPSQLIGPETSQRENAGNELELLRPMDVAAVHIDDAIEEKRAAVHALRSFLTNPARVTRKFRRVLWF
jgi:hypothetical protein